MIDPGKFINPSQVGGVESYTIEDGPGRGGRALCVNTGGGLRYRVLVDRGLDIDHAFLNQHSLAFLTHGGAMRNEPAFDRGLEWLKSFPGGLLSSCGPFNIGSPCTDNGESLGLHGQHNNTAAEIETIERPDPARGRAAIRIIGRLRYSRLYGPHLELRRTIESHLGASVINITDEFFNPGNTPVPHAWLLHINLGYPLLDEGAMFCWDARIEPRDDAESKRLLGRAVHAKRVPAPLRQHSGDGCGVAYLYPRAGRDGRATVGVVNRKLKLGLAVRYSTREFPRCGNWQHWGEREYVGALEPMNGTVDGRDRDRAAGLLDHIAPGGTKTYRYTIEAVTDGNQLKDLLALNAPR